ncbi:hypothetical protein FNV43_RR01792 [Rhamnella rubrinervis]|uniref:Uncharacterized protein n=1 Tax=Rhamnella rubrinervis TaxID=2594499 RepID=A0A8K0HR39_9ROSA|nr:hypothetical protein FNV43_RR01792 [Rhamnella rubrinervis]
MDTEWSESRYGQREERYDRDDSPMREPRPPSYDDLEENGTDKLEKHRSKDRKKSSRGEERDHRSKERERSKRSSDDLLKEKEREAKDSEKERVSSRERRKDDRDERDKDRNKDIKAREKDYDRDKYREKEREKEKGRKDRGKEKDREKEREVEKDSDRGREKERAKEKNRDRDRDKERDRDRVKEKERERDREKYKDREKGRESYKDSDKEKGKETKEKEREADQDKDKLRDRDSNRSPEDDYDWIKDGRKGDKNKLDDDDYKDKDLVKQVKVSRYSGGDQITEDLAGGAHSSSSQLEERILKMREERLKKKTDEVSEVLAWVNKSRKLEEKKNAEKEKALQLSKIFEEQDNFAQGESEDEEAAQHTARDLAGLKVLHGLDKVLDGGAVVLTLKDQNILADGDINEDVDMLENVEIGEQKRRDEAYKAAKKKTGTYDDKFNDDPGSEKKMLPQYDDPAVDEGVILDERGRFTGEAERKLEELRKRLQGVPVNNRYEDLNLPGKISSDYYTPEEMLQFKKPKKKKALRKKEKLDIDALEAEAVSAGLGIGDLGSRNDAKRKADREEQEKAEADRKNRAYQLAYAKADEASKSLRLEQTLPVKYEEDPVFVDEDEDLYKSLERARKLALKKKEEKASTGPEAIALLAANTASSHNADDQITGESQENRVVFTEMEEFVWGLQLDEEAHKPDGEDVFMHEDEEPKAPDEEMKVEAGGWTEVKDVDKDENPSNDDKEEIVPDETIHEVPVGKGLSGVLGLLKDRGTLKESIDWGGRNMDKKKSKLVGIVDDDEPKETYPDRQKKDEQKETRSSSFGHQKETRPPKVYQEKDIRIERTDEYGRILAPKEAFRRLSHKFHGKGPGKMKQEKRMKQYYEELKLKQMKSSDTPSLSVERMREAQAQLQTPYLVLSGHVKPGQTSDPRSGFATVEKELPGGLTPMLGDRKVEHFLGIKRKAEPANSGTPKKPKS